jgi:6,7-dimethyl-8-ribityllumazine synthase
MKFHNPHAIVALGAVIRGETTHYDYIAGESARGIAEISRTANIPIINGILTTDTARQAEDRSQVDGRNKGWDAIEAALQTISIYQEIFSVAKC